MLWKKSFYHFTQYKMIILLICILVSIVVFWCFYISKCDDFQKELEIHHKLVESILDRFEKHWF